MSHKQTISTHCSCPISLKQTKQKQRTKQNNNKNLSFHLLFLFQRTKSVLVCRVYCLIEYICFSLFSLPLTKFPLFTEISFYLCSLPSATSLSPQYQSLVLQCLSFFCPVLSTVTNTSAHTVLLVPLYFLKCLRGDYFTVDYSSFSQ